MQPHSQRRVGGIEEGDCPIRGRLYVLVRVLMRLLAPPYVSDSGVEAALKRRSRNTDARACYATSAYQDMDGLACNGSFPLPPSNQRAASQHERPTLCPYAVCCARSAIQPPDV